ncbi:MAG: hypothetical protein WBG57_13220 [Ornithinimicrobium sp.]
MFKQRRLALAIAVVSAVVVFVNGFYLDSVINWVLHVTVLVLGALALASWAIGARDQRQRP